jgi:hypothetical protein
MPNISPPSPTISFLHPALKELLDEHLTENGELLPPWKAYPTYERYSLGWRMGEGQDFIHLWHDLLQLWNIETRLEYFRCHLPLPLPWLDYVALTFGYEDKDSSLLRIESAEHTQQITSDPTHFSGIRWLASQGLCDFDEFVAWLRSEFS